MKSYNSLRKKYIKQSFLPKYIFLFGISAALGLYGSIAILQSSNSAQKNKYQSTAQASPQSTAKDAKEKCLKRNKQEYKNKYDCYAEYFYQFAKKTSPEDSFDAVVELKKLDPSIQKSCHPIGHGIGWAAYEMSPDDWNERIKEISTECTYGALMGMIERFASQNNGKMTEEVIKSLCGIKGGCNHGIGHVALVIEEDVDRALEMCSPLPNDHEERDWCYSGVFMEHMTMQNLAEHQEVDQERLDNWTDYIDEFEDFCNTYEGEKFKACWAQMAQTASIEYRGDPETVFDFCRRAGEKEAIDICQRRAVPYLNEFGGHDLEITKHACELAPEGGTDFKEYCYRQLAYTAGLSLPIERLSEIANYCSDLDDQYKNSCFHMLKSAINESREKIDIEKVCENASSSYKDKCLRG